MCRANLSKFPFLDFQGGSTHSMVVGKQLVGTGLLDTNLLRPNKGATAKEKRKNC
jgi:hypothetical protein